MRAILASFAKKQWFPALLGAGLIIAIGQNLWLGTANTALRNRLLEIVSQPLLTGDRVRELRGVDLDGHYREIDIGSSGALVAAISPFCGICMANRPATIELAARARASGLTVVWVSRERPRDTRTYFAGFPETEDSAAIILSEPPHDIYEGLRLSVVPQTLVLDEKGVVTASATGPLDLAKVELLERAIVKQAVGARGAPPESQGVR